MCSDHRPLVLNADVSISMALHEAQNVLMMCFVFLIYIIVCSKLETEVAGRKLSAGFKQKTYMKPCSMAAG